MELRDLLQFDADDPYTALKTENRLLRAEIRVAREAADITAKLVVEQFEKTEAILTRLEEAKDAMVAVNQEQAAIFESSPFGIAFIKDRVTIKANRKFEELFGYAPGEIWGQPTQSWYADQADYRAIGEAYAELEQGYTHQHIITMRRRDGTLFWARLRGSALSSDLTLGSVWTIEDVSAEHAAEEALLRAKEVAEQAERRLRDSYAELEKTNQRLQELDQLKSDFLSSVSHELRTPLTSIRGFARLVEREFARSFAPLAAENSALGAKAERIRDNLEVILKESDRLTRLINDVLDLAKIEAGRVEWRDAPISPETLVRDAVNAVKGVFDQKPGVALKVHVEERLPLFIGDADRMLQVLVNLISNSAKFTEAGEVTVSAERHSDGMIRIDITDTGIGFPPEDAEAIFDKFQQAKHGDTLDDRPKGTGLGLAISREIVERHGGRIAARSQPGKGSVFTVLLPPADAGLAEITEITSRIATVAACGHDEAAASSAPADGTLNVLVVDDDPGVRDYLAQLLQEHGYHVITAADGQAAMDAAYEHHPDLITMDLSMPVMDGRTAISRLRADPALREIPILVISALPGWDTAGGDLSMPKPLDESHFIENIRTLLGRTDSVPSTKVRFLVLYEMEQEVAMVPGGFTTQCEIDFCPLDGLLGRVEAGFQGMVVVPTHLLGKVDLSMLNGVPSLEVMILPVPHYRATLAGIDKH